MRIGIIGPIWLQIPPEKYGGTEVVVHDLAEGLVKAGHEVTLFAASTTKTSARLIPTIDKPLIPAGIGWDEPTAINYHLHHFLQAFQHTEEFDILHMHLNKVQDNSALVFALHSKTPVLFTFHYPIPTATYRPGKYKFLSDFPHFPYTSISNAARMGNDWNFVSTVYNSLDLSQYPFVETQDLASLQQGGYFAWLGKILPIKGLKESIEVAKKAGVQLKIMGAIDKDNPDSTAYFENDIKQLIDGKQIQFLGEADLKMKVEIFGKAKGFINALQWPEPFGLVMAEAQAMGAPVIALNKGAVAELVVNGKTGFVCESMDEMVDAVKKADTITREDCRAWVEEKFSRGNMIKGYEDAYTKTIQHWEEWRTQQRESINLHKNPIP
jgi:glycosyltransferase involved in cell wall biosynthesis